MTEHVKVLNDLELHGAFIMPDDSADFPSNPALGTFVIKDRCLYGYLRIGGMETWYPFASKTNSHVHTQGLPALTWTVTHNLGTSNVWIQVKDENGNIIGVGKTDVSDNQFQLTFTSAIKGTVVVVAPDTVDVPVVKASLIQVGANVEINTTGVLINGQYALTAANISAEIQAAIDAVVAGAPGALDTLNELAAALGNDSDYATTIINALALKADLVYVDAQIALTAANATLEAGAIQTDLAALVTTVSDKADLTYVNAQLSIQQAAISGTYTSAEVDTALALKADVSSLATVATSGSYADLSNKPTIPTVPTAVSAFTNDRGYQTSADVATAIQAVVGAAPAALDTLEEIAAQLANDESAAAALVTVVSGKADKATTLSGYGITLTSTNVTTALGFTPYNATTALSGGTF